MIRDQDEDQDLVKSRLRLIATLHYKRIHDETVKEMRNYEYRSILIKM